MEVCVGVGGWEEQPFFVFPSDFYFAAVVGRDSIAMCVRANTDERVAMSMLAASVRRAFEREVAYVWVVSPFVVLVCSFSSSCPRSTVLRLETGLLLCVGP